YQPAPLSEKALPDTFVVHISVLYKVPVLYSIVSGDRKGYDSLQKKPQHLNMQKHLAQHFALQSSNKAFHVLATFKKRSIFIMFVVYIACALPLRLPANSHTDSLKSVLHPQNLPATQIVQLKAHDNDTGRNGFLTYGILSGHRLKFGIEEATGILYSTAPFDYEEEPTEYQVVIYAEDDGIPEKKRGYCTVVIKIID
ncbi:FAT3 protein, partial [Nyctiprogne leucopyga]|nr:FAT3 protein [Nyctiprogne leucopyga]